MRPTAVVLLLSLLLGCAPTTKIDDPVLLKTPAAVAPAPNVLDMMATTVQVHVDIKATMVTDSDGKPSNEDASDGWVGSGVIYDKVDGDSMILTANHVLETPEVGSVETLKVDFMGMEMILGERRIDAVDITITTFDGRTCNLKPLVLGVSDTRDTATAVADCDAGRIAKIATATPGRGEKVYVSGHPMGVPLAMVTEGYVSGSMDGYLLISAGAYGGNSGGPVFYNGEVIGLLVRGSRSYTNISLVVPLESVRLRISETQPPDAGQP